MSTPTALHVASLDLSRELSALLRRVDPSSFREDVDAEARAALDRVARTLRELVARASEGAPGADALGDRLRALLASVERARGAAAQGARDGWAAFLREVHPAYEALAAALHRDALPAPSVRPTNHARSAFHVASAVAGLAAIRFVPTRPWLVALALAFAGFAWTCETLRRRDPAINARLMRLFGPVAHAHETHHVNSATWYCTALLALALALPLPAAAAAVAVLGVGDPAAAFVGRRWGRVRLRAGRSLEGTLAFFVVASLAAAATLAAFYPGTPRLVLAALAAGAAGALAELFSTRVDDNLSIPLASALAVTATADVSF